MPQPQGNLSNIARGVQGASRRRASEMLRAGVGFPAVMNLPGHTSPEMTMLYLGVTLSDLRREFDLAHAKPRHLAPQPKAPPAILRAGLHGVRDALLTAQHVLEMFRRALPDGASRSCLNRLSNRLTKIIAEARKLTTPWEWAENGRLCRASGNWPHPCQDFKVLSLDPNLPISRTLPRHPALAQRRNH